MFKIKLTKFIRCVIYVSIIGIASNFIGTALPRKWFNPGKFPYKSFKWEQNGKVYERIKIRKWKDRVPDMSKIYKRMVPKRFDISSNADTLMVLIKETCVAEFVHKALIVLGIFCRLIWDDIGGVLCSLLWAAGNVPFIFIQRYNRPKLYKTYLKLKEYERCGKTWVKQS